MSNSNAIEAWLEAGKGGYTTEQLQAAFTAVQNKKHWKMNIDAIVSAEYRDILMYAIPWYTGDGNISIEDCGDNQIHVLATGYWENGMEG